MTSDNWLPIGATLNDFDGDWQSYIQYCFEAFLEDFVHSKPTWPLNGGNVHVNTQLLDEKPRGFWHLVTEGSIEDERLFCFNRAERIRWPRIVLEELNSSYQSGESKRIVWWMEQIKNVNRLHIATIEFDYLLVVECRANNGRLITAFPIEHENQRRKKRAKWMAHRLNS